MKNTKLRRRLLAYAFSHCEDSYYVRELAVFISEDPGNLSRELNKLEKEGLFRSIVRGRIKLYSLNKNYPLFDDLKTLISKTEGIEGRLRDLFSVTKGVEIAFIYGSYAKNNEHKLSDIDVIVVGDFSENKLTEKIHTIEKNINREINFTSYKEHEFIKEKGKKGGFLELVLKEKIILLKGNINEL